MARTETFWVMTKSGDMLKLDGLDRARLDDIAIKVLTRRGHNNLTITDIATKGAQMTVTIDEKTNLNLMEESLEESTTQVEVQRQRKKS